MSDQQGERYPAAFLQSVLDALSATIAILGEDGTIMAVNAAWRRFGDENGLSWPDYGLGSNYLDTIDTAEGEQAEDAHYAACGIRAVMNGQAPEFSFEYPCHSPDEQRWYIMWATPLALPESRGAVVAHEDITARKLSELAAETAQSEAESARRAEARQRQVSERRRAVAASLSDVLNILNSDATLADVVEAIAEQALRLLRAHTVALFELGADQARLVRTVREQPGPPLRLSDQPDELARLATADQLPDEVRIISPPIAPDADGPRGAMLAALIDVESERYGLLLVQYSGARTFLHEEIALVSDFASQIGLAVANARLRERAERHAIAGERSRILRELHDSVSQALFTANLIADALPRLWVEHPEEAEEGLQELRRLTRTALIDMRGLLLDLGPRALTEKPLHALLHTLADAASSRSKTEVKESLEPQNELPAEVQIALYRIAEEALNNAVKHAEASAITLCLSKADQATILRIQDSGKGFDPSGVAPGHLGLGIMAERAKQIGAHLLLETASGKGTTVEVRWQPSTEATDDSR